MIGPYQDFYLHRKCRHAYSSGIQAHDRCVQAEKSKDVEAPHYAIFLHFYYFLPSYPNIIPNTFFSNTYTTTTTRTISNTISGIIITTTNTTTTTTTTRGAGGRLARPQVQRGLKLEECKNF
jgi:hypothetical protein